MSNLAGKYANIISRRPIASAIAGGLGAAGLATAGNILSGELEQEGVARTGLEALGACVLGAFAGKQVPALRGRAGKFYRDIGNVSLTNQGAQARKAEMSAQEIQSAEFMRDLLNQTVRSGEAVPAQLREDLKTSAKRTQAGLNATVIPASLLAAGAAGGMIGGGVANIASAAGIPLDPEAYGPSNSPGAISKPTTVRYV